MKKLIALFALALCFALPAWAQPSIEISSASPCEGNDPICIDFRVNDMTDIVGTSYTVEWDSSVLQFVEATNFNPEMVNLSAASFDATFAPNGQLIVDWESGTCGPDVPSVTLDDGTLMFSLCFEPVSATYGDTTSIRIVPNLENPPAPIDIIRKGSGCDRNIGLDEANNLPGFVSVCVDPVEILIAEVTANEGDFVCVDFQVNGFDDLTSLQFSVDWDSTLLQYNQVQPNDDVIDNLSLSSFGTPDNFGRAGSVTVSWSFVDVNNEGRSYPDSTLFFSLCFDVIGSCESIADINISSDPLPIEVTNTIEAGFNIPFQSNTGRVNVGPCDPEGVILTADCGPVVQQNDEICVAVTAAQLNNINELNYLMEWNESILRFQEVRNINAALTSVGFDAGAFNESNVLNGVLGVEWEAFGPSLSVNDGTVLYEVCFTVAGLGGNSPFRFTGSPMVARQGGTNIGIAPQNCAVQVEQPQGVVMNLANVQAPLQDTVCIDVSVDNFTEITQYQFSLAWEINEIDFLEVANINPALGATVADNFNLAGVDGGSLSFQLTPGAPLDLDDGTVLFSLCYVIDSMATPNTCGLVERTDLPIATRAERSDSNNEDVGVEVTGGEVCFQNPAGFFLIANDTSGFINDTLCLPFKVGAFEDIVSAEFTVNWEIDGLQFNGINVPANDLGLTIDNFDTTNANVGIVGVDFTTPAGVTLDDSTVIYEICYTLLGPVENCFDVEVNNIPLPSVTTTDGQGSVFAEVGEICIEDRLIITDGLIQGVSCIGDSDGTIQLSVEGGQGPVFFNWNTTPPQNQPNGRAINLPAGAVSVTIFDSSTPPLVLRDTFMIPQADPPPVADAGPDIPLDCNGLTRIEGTGSGAANLTYRWTTLNGAFVSPTDQSFVLVNVPGTYFLRVTNSETGCFSSDTMRVTTANLPTADAGDDQVFDCTTTQVILDGSNSSGGAGIEYQWTALDGGTIAPGDENLVTPAVEAPGTYLLEVIEAATGCSATDSVVVIDNFNFPMADAGDDEELGCDGDTVTLSGRGSGNIEAVTYLWTDAAGNIISDRVEAEVATLGTYFLEVTDVSSGCSLTDSVMVIPSADFPEVVTLPDTALNCNASEIILTSVVANADSFAFDWTAANGGVFQPGTDTTLMPVVNTAGTYIISVVNTENNCETIDSIAVTEDFTEPLAEAGDADTLTCNETSLTLDGAGSATGSNITYAWGFDGSTIAEDTLQLEIFSAGTYFLTVTDLNNGCTGVDSVVVFTDDNIPTIELVDAPILSCAITEVQLQVNVSALSPGPSILWTPLGGDGNIVSGATTETPVVNQAGTYRIEVTDAESGCIGQRDVIVEADTLAPVAQAGDTQILTCDTESLTLSAAGSASGPNIRYTWSGGAGGVDPMPNNTFEVEVTAAGIYTLEVLDTLNGCTGIDSVLVAQDTTLPNIIIADPGILSCTDTVLSLDASQSDRGDEIVVQWTALGGQPINPTADPYIIEVTQGGSYQLGLTNTSSGCESIQVVEITADQNLPTAEAGPETILDCPDTPVALDGTGSTTGAGISYLWTALSGGGTINGADGLTPEVSAVGTYQIEVLVDSTGCSASDQVNVVLNPELTPAQVDDPQQTVCGDEMIMLFANDPANATGRWTSPTGASIEFPTASSTGVDSLQPGTNIFIWTLSTEGCIGYSADSALVQVANLPTANDDLTDIDGGGPETPINVAANDLLFGGAGIVTLLSQPSIGTARVDSGNAGQILYQPLPGLFGSDEFTYRICSSTCPDLCDSATVRVNVRRDDSVDENIVNGITPNGDGFNDQLIFDVLELAPDNFPDNELIVFNRWGDIVFQAQPYMNNWDGTTENGNPLPDGTYYYILRLDISEGLIYKGHITILK